jgi:hypothetical protein
MDLKAKHSENSTLRERIVEHLFIGDVLQYFWQRNELDVEVLRSEFDSGGYDLVISKASVTRHIQLKTSIEGGSRKDVSVSINLEDKLNGCVIWIVVDGSLNRVSYYWLGSPPSGTLNISGYKVTKHSKGNSEGKKAERPNHRTIPKSAFEHLKTLNEVVEKLFG